MALDTAGKTIDYIMEGRDFTALDYEHPHWRLETPSLLKGLLNFGKTSYEKRFIQLLTRIFEEYPGAFITHSVPPPGQWDEVEFSNKKWKNAEAGTVLRGYNRGGEFANPEACHGAWQKAWVIPQDFDLDAVITWLSVGGWAIWKAPPAKKIHDLPRIFSQDAYKTLSECGFDMLMISWWDNAYTEIALAETKPIENTSEQAA